MALRNDIEGRLVQWAAWSRARAEGRIDESALDDPVAVVRGDEDAREVDRFVAALSPKLQAIVLDVYVEAGPAAERCLRLGSPETLIIRRLGRVHLLLADHFAEGQARSLRERERLMFTCAPSPAPLPK